MSVTEKFDLSGRVAVVTGGGRGIGEAVSLGLADAGAAVVPAARTESEIEATAEAVRERGGEALAVPTDITDAGEVDDLIGAALEEFGTVDVVVNNAGANPDAALGKPEDVSPEGFDLAVDVNLKGAFLCTRAAAEGLYESDGGTVVNIASVGGLVGLPRQHPYVAGKHGLVGITKSMALDWAPEVRVNAVAPGYVRTELIEEAVADDSIRESLLRRTPVDRFAEPEEIAAPVVFLASEAASYVTGACLAVDGGWTAR